MQRRGLKPTIQSLSPQVGVVALVQGRGLKLFSPSADAI